MTNEPKDPDFSFFNLGLNDLYKMDENHSNQENLNEKEGRTLNKIQGPSLKRKKPCENREFSQGFLMK